MDDPSNTSGIPPKTPGGTGGLSAPLRTTSDVRLVERALAESWPMDPAVKAQAVRRLEEVITDPDRGLRAVLAATNALASLSRINLSAVDVALRAKSQEELEERLTELEKRFGNKGDTS
jgi:hypothetical protein